MIGENLKQQTVRNPSVQNMYPVYAFPNRIGTVRQFRQHAAADTAFLNQFFRLCRRQSGNKSGFIFNIPVKPLDVRQKGQFFCGNCLCNRARRVIGIDIIRLKMLIQSDWRNDGQKILFQQVV